PRRGLSRLCRLVRLRRRPLSRAGAEELRCAQERIGRPVELHGRAVLVADDAKNLALLAAADRPEPVRSVRLEHGRLALAAREPRLEAPATNGEDDLRALGPPA